MGTGCAFALRGGASDGAVPGAPGSLTPGMGARSSSLDVRIFSGPSTGTWP